MYVFVLVCERTSWFFVVYYFCMPNSSSWIQILYLVIDFLFINSKYWIFFEILIIQNSVILLKYRCRNHSIKKNIHRLEVIQCLDALWVRFTPINFFWNTNNTKLIWIQRNLIRASNWRFYKNGTNSFWLSVNWKYLKKQFSGNDVHLSDVCVQCRWRHS